MILHDNDGQYQIGFSLEELKILYRALWNDMKSHPDFQNNDTATDMMFELQLILQKEAQRFGVDVGVHSEWAAFVGLEGGSCSL